MNNLIENPVRVKGADVKINTETLLLTSGGLLLQSILSNKIEASSIEKASKYLKLGGSSQTNHFLLMLQIAFSQHKPISISPDDIWLLICQGFSQHIKLHSEDFKKMITGTEQKQTLTIRRDDFILGKENHWEEVFPEFTKKISQSIHTDLYNNFILEFSTSTKKEINAFEIAFMDTMSSYFNYDLVTMCGIPQIEIKGTRDDYKKIITALEELKNYNLEWWIDKVIPKIEKILEAIDGQYDSDFWNSIFKERNASGGPYITGWITDFFPYIIIRVLEEDGIIDFEEEGISKNHLIGEERGGYMRNYGLKFHSAFRRNNMLYGEIDNGDKRSFPKGLKYSNFPSGKSIVPFKWKYLKQELNINFISGFIGIREDESTNTLSTDINWIVSRK